MSRFSRFNGIISHSKLHYFNATLGLRSTFTSIFNFDYDFSLLFSKNKIKSPSSSTSSVHTLLHQVNLYITPEQLFHTTITMNRMVSNRGDFQGNFLDITLNRKLWKEKLLVELKLRNIFDIDLLSNQSVSTFYKRENNVLIRGREFFFTLRYEIR